MILDPWNDPVLGSLLVGESHTIRTLRSVIVKLAESRGAVWIEGETGVGKEHVARAIHLASRPRGPLVAVNVCALPEAMFEAAMFGHVRGAFTGAIRASAGYMGEANHGTLFLDEIGSLGSGAQAKLLRAVETRTYRPVGGHRDVVGDFRIVAATNVPYNELSRAGSFREDLGYRLRAFVIQVPPLRARPQDVPLLASHLLGLEEGSGPSEVTDEATDWLMAHPWPGNVRELRQLLHVARTLSEGSKLTTADLRRALEMSGHVGASRAFSLDERNALLDLLQAHDWDTASAAQSAGVDRSTIYRWMRGHGITLPRHRSALGLSRTILPSQ